MVNNWWAVGMATLAAFLWAASGTVAQDFLAKAEETPLELTAVRMLSTSVILLILTIMSGGLSRGVRTLKSEPKLIIPILLYAIAGIMMMQFTYFMGIDTGGAAATTVISYTCPAMVVLYLAICHKRRPKLGEWIAVIMAMVGVVLLVTGGNLAKLSVPMACVLWSLASAVAFAFVTIYPVKLLQIFDRYFLLSIAMFAGGGMMYLLAPTFQLASFFRQDIAMHVGFIVIFGTVIAFVSYNASLKYLSPQQATVTATIEPVASVFLATMVFGIELSTIQILGTLMVVIAILIPTILDDINAK